MEALGFHWPSLIVYMVNFLILLAILRLVAYKPILRLLDQRSTRIRESLEAAERVRRESEESQAEMQRQLELAHQEGQQLLAQAREMAERYRQGETEKARQEAEAFIQRAHGEIQRERDTAIEEVRRHFADLAITAAERVITRSLDKETHKDLIEEVLQKGPTPGRG